MLKGYMNCLCEDGNVRHYLLTGLDSSSSLQLLVESHLYDDNEYIAFPSGLEEKGVNPADVDVKEARRVDIGLSSVKVETCRVDVEVPKPKTINCPVNTEIFVRLGALIRYSKSKCFGANNVEYTGLKVSSDEYTPNLYQTYNIPIDNQPVGGKICLQSFIDREDLSLLGTITLLMGEINKLSLVSPYIEIKLEEDGMNPQFPVLRAFTTSVSKGFRQDEDYLGFKVEYAKASTNLDQGSAWGYYTKVEDIVAAHPEKNFSWLLDRNYNIVSDENLDEIITKIWDHKGIVSYDTETTGLNINFKSRIGQADQAVGIVISIEEGTSYYFPLQHKAIKNLCGGDHKYFMERYMKPILENKDLLAHNGPFDWKVAHIYGINAHIVEDTLGLLKLTIGAEKFDFRVGLKESTAVLLHRDSLELSDLLVDNSWGESDVKFWDLPYELVRLYACADTDNTLALWHYAKKADLLHKYNATRVYNIEMAFGLAVAYQEFYGHCINVEQVEQLKVDTDKGMEESFKKLIDIVGHDFNPNSSQQLMQIMYDELGYPEQINRKNNRRTSDAKALKDLAGITDIEGKPKYPLANALLEYRGYEQIRKTFIKNLDTLATEDGYIFSEVKQYGTTTGRVSIANPNYQSYNDTVKKNIVPRPGYYMTDSDYSSVEYRVLCSMAGQEEIKEAFKDPELDYHAYQAARMFQIPYEAVTKKLRKSAKGINFGLPYGMGDESLGVAIFGEESPENTREAKRLRELYFVGQEKIRDFFEEKRNYGVKNGFTETKYGRRRYYNRAKFSEKKIRRQAGNQVVQGCIYPDTLLQTQELGLVRIADVAGMSLHVWDGKEWTLGDVLYSGKKQKCIVKFTGGYQMICSPIHKFLVRSKRGHDRFVECQDLATKATHKNPHRVVVCQNEVKSDYKYTSDRSNLDWYGTTPNSNNVFLDAIKDSFTRGVVLGRLASDGSVGNEGEASNRVVQIVAEHELDVYDYLVDAMTPLNCNYSIDDVRPDRNERLAHVSVYSKTLANEIRDLDIRHRIDKRIFADTEMLRGFLCGMFDGDGGISGKAIILTQGTQENFEPLMKDIQKALLFFGIRSRYREYDDRYVLQIRTGDNERFVNSIGFINHDKQMQAIDLEPIEDEHIFGTCLMVESVEITDEYIDMYDVCNTEKGYYVADGVVTHNTAADIYKIATGRLFQKICEKGWLGKVLMPAFVHDEVLCEIHESIDPMVWLKTLRECFEVKIEGFCPLYVGFGFGMNWYTAKSVEIPSKLQWELEAKYGDTGYPKWNDMTSKEFCDSIPDLIMDFEIREIIESITAPEHQGGIIKPAINTYLHDALGDKCPLYNKAVESLLDTDYVEGTPLPQSLVDLGFKGMYIKDGKITKVSNSKDLQEALDMFCAMYGIDRSTVNQLSSSDVVKKDEGTQKSKGYTQEDFNEEYDDYMQSEQRLANMILAKLTETGVYVDNAKMHLYISQAPDQYLQVIQNLCITQPNGSCYRLYLVKNGVDGRPNLDDVIDTNCYFPTYNFATLMQCYRQLINTKKLSGVV